MWHYSVEFAKGEIKAIIIPHPAGPTVKPTARIEGARVNAAWDRLGKARIWWAEQNTLQGLYNSCTEERRHES